MLRDILVSLDRSWARLESRRLKALWMVLFFSVLIQGVKPSSPLSASIDPPNVSIDIEYLGTCNHVPRKATVVTLNKRTAVMESGGSYLHKCSEEPMSDQQRLKMGSCVWSTDLQDREAMNDQQKLKNGFWKDGIRNRYILVKVPWYNMHNCLQFKTYYDRGLLFAE